jgi:hypothetical protein
MTIRKLGPYGTPVSRPSDLVVKRNDRELAQHFISPNRATPCTLTKGSIAQSLGITGHAVDPISDPNQQMTRVDIDLLQIEYRTDTSEDVSSQLVVAGSLALQHRTALSTSLILSNSGILRGRDVLPRAHPNDGFVDVLEIDQEITLRQMALAWSRSRTGSHLPHPHFRVSRATDFQWSGSPSKMVADGVAYDGVVTLQCTVLADAMAIYF